MAFCMHHASATTKDTCCVLLPITMKTIDCNGLPHTIDVNAYNSKRDGWKATSVCSISHCSIASAKEGDVAPEPPASGSDIDSMKLQLEDEHVSSSAFSSARSAETCVMCKYHLTKRAN